MHRADPSEVTPTGAPARLAVRSGSRRAPALVRALRPLQWTKNGVLLAALVFDTKVFEGDALWRGIAAVVIFCFLSSGVYLVNDVRDAAADRLHPTKRFRPIASGEVSPRLALAVAVGLFGLALVGSWFVRPEFVLVGVGYVALMVAYSLGLKRLVILDVFAIAAGFVLRAAGGAVAISVTISPWLLLCTMLLALLIGFGKRRHELSTLSDAAAHRANLDAYSLPLLDQLIATSAAATVMAYAFYTFDAPAVPDNRAMMLTIPFVTYAIFRYLFLIHRRELGGTPEALLFGDRPLFASILAWGLTSLAILYAVG